MKKPSDLLRAIKNSPHIFVILALCLAAFCLLAGIASEVREGETLEIDRLLLLMLRNPADVTDPIGGPWLEEIMRDLTALGGMFFVSFVTIAGFIYLLVVRRRAQAAYLLSSIGTGLLFSSLLKYGFDRPRPDLVPHGSIVYTSSFPSGHSLMSALAYLTLGAMLAEAEKTYGMKVYIMSIAVLMTLLTGFSRVYLGVHWPSDVLAGWLAGAAWAMMAWLVWARVLHARKKGRH